MMNKDEFRRDSFSGSFSTDRGYIQISEDYHGEGYHIETWDNVIGELQKLYLRADEIFALAKAGVINNIFGASELSDEVAEVREANEKRERELDKIRRAYSDKGGFLHGYETDYESAHADLPGGDGTPEYYAVEGWGIQKLSNGDFEVYLNDK